VRAGAQHRIPVADGTLLLWDVEKPRRPDGSFAPYTEIPTDLASTIAVNASLTEPLLEEHPGPLL
jgi:hypothetical protein